MIASTFDALGAARALEAAGIERPHAEAIAEGLRRAALADRDELATKADIAAVNGRIAGLNSRIDGLNSRIGTLQWVVGVQSAITLATFAIVAAKLL